MDVLIRNAPYLFGGLMITLLLASGSLFGSMIVGSLLAVAGRSKLVIVRGIMRVYITGMRAIPVLVWILYIYFVLAFIGFDLEPLVAVLIALILYRSTYVAEVLKSGLLSIHQGQYLAAMSGGLSRFQTMRFVIGPQVLRNMRPALISEGVKAIKDSTLASLIGVFELLHRIQIINLRELNQPLILYGFAAVMYFAICFGLSQWASRLGGANNQLSTA